MMIGTRQRNLCSVKGREISATCQLHPWSHVWTRLRLCGAVLPVSYGAEEFWWHWSLVILSMFRAPVDPAVCHTPGLEYEGQLGPQELWTARDISSPAAGLMLPPWWQQVWQLCPESEVTAAHVCCVRQHGGSCVWLCRKSLQSYVNLGQNESVNAVISSCLAFLTNIFEYNIPLQCFPAEISIKNVYIQQTYCS